MVRPRTGTQIPAEVSRGGRNRIADGLLNSDSIQVELFVECKTSTFVESSLTMHSLPDVNSGKFGEQSKRIQQPHQDGDDNNRILGST